MWLLDGEPTDFDGGQSNDLRATRHLTLARELAASGVQRQNDHSLLEAWTLRAGVRLAEVQQEAAEALRNQRRFTYYANGRP